MIDTKILKSILFDAFMTKISNDDYTSFTMAELSEIIKDAEELTNDNTPNC